MFIKQKNKNNKNYTELQTYEHAIRFLILDVKYYGSYGVNTII